MIPRGQLDIGWADLLAGAAWCFAPGRREAMDRGAREAWSREPDTVVCLSVRSGLDLLLTALAYPEGSEVLVSAVTIRDMVRIIEHHGLVAVPVDLDMESLRVRMESVSQAVTPRTKAVLVAHLFGSRMPLDELLAFARARGLFVIEDCAQSFTGPDYRGHPGSDAALFSFGPIKTSTALGGAVVVIRDPALLGRVRALQSQYPVQGRVAFFKRLCRFALVRSVLNRPAFTAFCFACRRLGKSHDDVISRSVRGFAGPDLFSGLRRQPSTPLLALLRRRLKRFDGRAVERRRAAAEALLRSMPGVDRPGRDAAHHSYWAFPVRSPSPDELVGHLWSHGFDATRGAWSLYAVPAPESGGHAAAREAEEVMRGLVYLPVWPHTSEADLERLARAATEARGASSSSRAPRTAVP